MNNKDQTRRIFRKIFRWIGWIIISLVLLFCLFIALIRLPSVQRRITQRAVSFLEKKIGTPVSIEELYVGFPKRIILKGLYLQDQNADTLLYIKSLAVDTDLWKLLDNEVQLNDVSLSGSAIHLERLPSPDSTFNFDYIIAAFKSGSAPVNPEDTTSWKFSVNRVQISDVGFVMTDSLSGNVIHSHIGSMDIHLDEVDPAGSVYKIGSLTLSNTRASVVQWDNSSAKAPHSPGEEDEVLLPDIDFKEIGLSNVSVGYGNKSTGLQLTSVIGDLKLKANDIDLRKQLVDLDELRLEKSQISYRQDSMQKNVSSSADTIPKKSLWNIRLKKISLSDNTVAYADKNFPQKTKTSGGIDPNNFSLSPFNISATNLVVSGDQINVDLDHLDLAEKSGFIINSLSGSFRYSEKELNIKDLLFRSPNSTVKLDATLTPQTIPLVDHYKDAAVDVNLQNSFISEKDILYFYPTLHDSLMEGLPSIPGLKIDGEVRGKVDDLTIENLNISVFDSTRIAIAGKIQGLSDSEKIRYQITKADVYTTASDLTPFLPDSLADSFRVPPRVNVKSKFTGTADQADVTATISSGYGNLSVQGQMNWRSLLIYNVRVTTEELNVGMIMKQEETVGKLSMQADVQGSGLNMKDIDTHFKLDVGSFKYRDYVYKDFNLQGALKNYLFTGQADFKDDNLDFDLKGDLDYQKDTPAYTLTFNLRNANLKELHFSERPMKVKATLDVELATENFKAINGHLDIRHFAIYNGDDLYKVDSLLFVSIDQEGKSNFSISSDIIAGDFEGTFNIFTITDVLKQFLNQYFSLNDSAITTFDSPQNFKFNLTILNTDLLTEIIFPELEPFVPGKIEGEFDSEKKTLTMQMDIAKLKYGSVGVDLLEFNVDADRESLKYSVRFKNLQADTLNIAGLNLSGTLRNNVLKNELQLLDSVGENKYFVAFDATSRDSAFYFHITPSSLLINYENWQLPDNNKIALNPRGISITDFRLSKENQQLSISTDANDSTMLFHFANFQLSNLTRFISGVLPAGGEINGDLKLTITGKGEFHSLLKISSLTVLEKQWGNATLTLDYSDDLYKVAFDVASPKQKIEVGGFYKTGTETPEYNFKVNFSPLDLSIVEPLSFGRLKNVKGSAEGVLSIKNRDRNLSVNGKMTFTQASFLVTYLGSPFTLQQETLTFNDAGIDFNSFTIQDDKSNKAIIRGSIKTTSYTKFELDLNVTSSDFQLLNTTAKDNGSYYGVVRVSMEARISGGMSHPKVNLDLRVNDGTTFTYLVSASQKSALEKEGIVKFVDRDAQKDPFLTDIQLNDSTALAFTGFDLTANIDLTDAATLNIVIDPASGDQLSVSGNANLALDMDAYGSIRLAGRYEIVKGSYNFSFRGLAKREFTIQRGSSITWSGDPINGVMDVRAVYNVEAPPIDLVYNQLTTTNKSETNAYSQRLPFLVYLMIKGKLLLPEITFRIDMPENKRSVLGGAVYAKIQDINSRESDLNKQVFALLILKRFISDNPLESQAAGSVANTTRVSVSRILSEQLNRLSENVKGVELNFDIKSYEDYSGEEVQGQTKLQLGVSKNLLHDRLVVKLSGNLDVEGQEQQANVTDYIGDIALEYKLTSDGRFKITGFRNSDYDMIDGELTETGVGLIYVKDYNTLKELFKSNAK